MSYDKKSIKEIIEEIDANKVFLPALQRKFVWGKEQIELLFDSIMRNYPIGTFLFWKLGLGENKKSSYVFYEFLREYDQRNPYNRRKTGVFLCDEIIGILDGQQRLSSMYVGLMGTHTEKKKYAKISSPNAYSKTCLYLNLLSLPYEINSKNNITLNEEKDFEFRFLTDEDAKQASRKSQIFGDGGSKETEETVCWLKVGNALGWGDDLETDNIFDKVFDRCNDEQQKNALSMHKRVIRFAFTTLHKRIHIDDLISYFTVTKDDLEDILKIFVRVNSGGTVLNKTDLLFSTIVATWEDGREEIEKLLKQINSKGDDFSFGNEYLMRCCLMLTDGPVLFKVNSFKTENVSKIKTEWPEIAKAVSKTVDLLVEFGYNDGLLSSQNATLIIAYYIYKGGSLDQESKANIRKYLNRVLLKRVYGSSQDQVLRTLRNALREKEQISDGLARYSLVSKDFSFETISNAGLSAQKSLNITNDDIDHFLQFKKGGDAFLVLSLLYPNLKYSEKPFHQDHIHPFSKFKDAEFNELGLSDEEKAEWIDRRDRVPNLQMLEGRENQSKKDTSIEEWIDRKPEEDSSAFKRENYFPKGVDLKDIDLNFSNFKEFYEGREDVLRRKLISILEVETEKQK